MYFLSISRLLYTTFKIFILCLCTCFFFTFPLFFGIKFIKTLNFRRRQNVTMTCTSSSTPCKSYRVPRDRWGTPRQLPAQKGRRGWGRLAVTAPTTVHATRSALTTSSEESTDRTLTKPCWLMLQWCTLVMKVTFGGSHRIVIRKTEVNCRLRRSFRETLYCDRPFVQVVGFQADADYCRRVRCNFFELIAQPCCC